MKISLSSVFSRLNRRFLPVIAGAFAAHASAHEVWIEDAPDGQIYVRFAEFGEKYEQSPGALDAITLPFAWAPGAEVKDDVAKTGGNKEERDIRAGKVEAFEVQKKADGFLLSGAKAGQSIQAETGFTVMGKPGDPEKPARKPYFYARWQPAGAGAGQPSLNFDLVPTGTPGTVCVYLRGKPLVGAKVKFYPPGAADQELISDAEGLVHFTASKPGLYLLAAGRQRETTPGFFGGKPYDVVSHNCSLAWRQP